MPSGEALLREALMRAMRLRFFVAVMLAGACAACGTGGRPGDPDFRSFKGNIVKLDYDAATMKIAKGEQVGRDAFVNLIIVKYDPKTQFLMDGQPTTLDRVQQYMTVRIDGHMRDGQLFAETADFSSVLPANVRPATTQATAK